MNKKSRPIRHELLDRKVVAWPSGSFPPRHFRDNLRNIANDFQITKRRMFYEVAHDAAEWYFRDKMVEEDLLNSAKARRVFRRAIRNGLKFSEDCKEIFGDRALYSLWNEPYFTCEGELEEMALAFKRDELPDQVFYFVILTLNAFSTLARPAPSRKKNLALRKWATRHLCFWVNELGRPITVINDRRDGYSSCHRFLRALLAEIEPDSGERLGSILRELREESAPE